MHPQKGKNTIFQPYSLIDEYTVIVNRQRKINMAQTS